LLYYTFAARGFDTEAAMILANKYLRGYDVVKSCTSALPHYRLVAEKGFL
jgi:TPR repeat protein